MSKCTKALTSFNDIASGWKRMISLFGLFATVIILTVLSDDMAAVADVVKSIGIAFGFFGTIASVAKVVSE